MKTKEMISASTISDIINFIYSETFFSGYSHSFSYDFFIGEEIFSEYILKVCEEPTEKMLKLFNTGCFNYYSARIIKNMVINKYSKVNKNIINFKYDELSDYKNYNQDDCDEPSSIEVDELIQNIHNFLDKYEKENKGGWYDVTLFKMYYFEDNTYREMEKLTKIPSSSLFHSVTKLKNLVVESLGTDYEEIFKNK